MAIRNVFEHVKQLSAEIDNLEVEDLKRELDTDKEVLLLDLRELQEWVDMGTIPGAVHVPRGMLEFWADPASPYARDYFGENKRTVVFCAGGGRSVYAVKALEDMGFTDVAHLSGGFKSWLDAGESVETTAENSRWARKE